MVSCIVLFLCALCGSARVRFVLRSALRTRNSALRVISVEQIGSPGTGAGNRLFRKGSLEYQELPGGGLSH